jgi:hypothetical protein
MVFVIFDSEKGEFFRSDNPEKIEEIQEAVNYHPSYSCDLLLSDDGCLYIDNGCGEIRGVPNKYQFMEYIEDND